MYKMEPDLPRTGNALIVGAAALAALIAGTAVFTLRSEQDRKAVASAMIAGNVEKAPLLFRHYGCAGCHEIPGIPGADGKVGGSLSGLRGRVYIGGVLTNTPDHLVRWIVSPQTFSPRTAMPATGISEAEAKDLAAYLYGR